ncbi:MAG: 4-hydroxy-tetrahydrodipicolinate reductase [Actinomycetota bacterium]|nr:4-hydroxy-tetrahydrodipicolinate reductase [Actinomycetota bacterium]
MIRVGVIGACGRVGRLVCRGVVDDPDLALVAAIDRSRTGERIGHHIGRPKVDVTISDDLEMLVQADAEVAVDFTHPEVVLDNVRWAISHAVDIVVGATGISEDGLAEIPRLLEAGGGESNVLVAPNFAMGAVMMQRFAEVAARFFPAVEIIELHHDGKVDAPSGTSLATARRIAAARADRSVAEDPVVGATTTESVSGVRGGRVDGVPVHSVRLPGLVAHQEVIFGSEGETLTIRHDSTDRSSFIPGVLLAVKRVSTRPGLTVGLEPLLDLPPSG